MLPEAERCVHVTGNVAGLSGLHAEVLVNWLYSLDPHDRKQQSEDTVFPYRLQSAHDFRLLTLITRRQVKVTATAATLVRNAVTP